MGDLSAFNSPKVRWRVARRLASRAMRSAVVLMGNGSPGRLDDLPACDADAVAAVIRNALEPVAA
jgi:hypothetical protein